MPIALPVSIPTRDLVRSRRPLLPTHLEGGPEVSIPTRDLVRSRQEAAIAACKSDLFQSLQGIWFDRDLIGFLPLSLLLRLRGFNPYKGFGSIATTTSSWLIRWSRKLLFQSLQGIWFDRDLGSLAVVFRMPESCFNPYKGFGSIATIEQVSQAHPQICFNPYKGFGSIATIQNQEELEPIEYVSIPTRDLVRSRQNGLERSLSIASSFNPYKGFGSIATE